jgi:hypothetical protein
VTIPSTKGLTLACSGACAITNTVAIRVNSNSSTVTRLTGFTFTGGDDREGDAPVQVSGSTSSAYYRIDHNTFTSSTQAVFILLNGNGPGLIDHNRITANNNAETIHNDGTGPSSNAGWTDNIVPGGSQMLFIEDNTYINNGTSAVGSAVQAYYGARTVFRHNTMSFFHFDAHGTPGAIGARWWEIYNNTLSEPAGLGSGGCCFAYLRAGSGVVWGNACTNCLNGEDIHFYEEDRGTFPLAYQVGSGINGHVDGFPTCSGPLNTAPAHVWGNTNLPVTLNDSGFCTTCIVRNRDVFEDTSKPASIHWEEASGDTCSTTYTYTPYTYPHPLQGASSGPPPPTGLAAIVQ